MNHLAAMRVFVRTVETGSLTRAAAGLALPKSSASKLLSNLEEHLGIRLLIRSTRSLTLTSEGEEYYAQVSALLSRLQNIEDDLRHKGRDLHGRVRVDVHSSMANMVLIPALPEFHARHPRIQIAMGISDRPVGLIEEAVDCVVRLGPLPDSSLIAKTIYQDRLLTCASPAYLTAFAMPQTPDDLRQDHRLIGYFSALSGEARPLQFRKDGHDIDIDHADFLSNESTGQVNMILNGLGIGQTYQSTVQAHLASGALISVLDDWSTRMAPVSVLYPPSKKVNARTRAFIDWLSEHLARQAAKANPGVQVSL